MLDRLRYAKIRLLLSAWTVLLVSLSIPAAAQMGGPALVKVAVASVKDIASETLVPGTVVSRDDARLSAEVEGRLTHVADVGTAVTEGEVVAEIEATALRLEKAELEAEVVRAEARVAEAQTALERELATAEIKKEEWRDNRKNEQPTDFALNLTQVAQAKAMLRAARADLDKARLDLERTEIRVPFHGRVRSRNVGIGQYVSAGMPMGRVFSIDTVEVRLPLTDAQLTELRLPLGFTAGEYTPAPAVQFSATLGPRDYAWQGAIVRIDASIDEDTRLIYATAEVRDPYGLAAADGMPMAVGMFVNADIAGVDEQQAYVMPRLALRNKDTVYVINEDNELEIRTVEVLSTSEERVVVTGGVAEGDLVVTSPVPNAVDGMSVEPIFRNAQS